MKKVSSNNKRKVRQVSERFSSPTEKQEDRVHRNCQFVQASLDDFIIHPPDYEEERSQPIQPGGDELVEKSDNNIRIILQNPNGIRLRDSIEVLPEVHLINKLQADIAAFPESKLSRDGQTKELMERQMRVHLGSSIVISSSAKKIHHEDKEYQPGGVMLALSGKTTGRHIKGFSDPWGRYAYTKLRGSRGEGVIVIAAYRVCQKAGTRAGPNTAYTQQIGAMMEEELQVLEDCVQNETPIPRFKPLDPRARLLKDLGDLISEERAKGFRPILCMDANEDWTLDDGQALHEFLTQLQLSDHLYDKYGSDLPTSTYS